MKKLYKIEDEKKISGVCAGIAELLNADVTLIRVITFFLCWFFEFGLIIYLLLACLLPDKSELR